MYDGARAAKSCRLNIPVRGYCISVLIEYETFLLESEVLFGIKNQLHLIYNIITHLIFSDMALKLLLKSGNCVRT